VLKKKIKLLIFDYLQLVKLGGKDKRVDEINETVAGLKTFAMTFDIPVIVVSATNNKQITDRMTRKPIPADLRDSGRIANDCDVLMFLWSPNAESDRSYRELFISRGRNGESGSVGLTLNTSALRFEETPLKYFNDQNSHRLDF
jgi:replicative DNA helicase